MMSLPRAWARSALVRGGLALVVVLVGLGGADVARAELPAEPLVADSSATVESSVGELAAAESLSSSSWPMVAANPQRTSWNSVEVRGTLRPIWYRVIDAYIPPKVQVIAAGGLLYVSTAAGLYAFHADTGATAWVYPTEMPLGNSPTIHGAVAYVAGYDRRVHAINAATGAGIWTFQAGAGFDSNPLVLELNGRTLLYLGCRDGKMYAIEDHGSYPSLAWSYATDGPISYSAAYSDGVVYVASDDAHAYALDALTGGLVWQSAKLPGAGFHAWWPVIYQEPASGADLVLLAGSDNYRAFLAPGMGNDMHMRDLWDVFPNRDSEPKGTPFGTRTGESVNASRVLQYLEAKPWRRTFVVLNRSSGLELTSDSDHDGSPEYAPILWFGTHSGNRYPAVIASNGTAYQTAAYMSDPYIAGGHLVGWRPGSNAITTPSARWGAADEPIAYSSGGTLLYWNLCNDRGAGSIDLSITNTRFYPTPVPYDSNREWLYFAYNLHTLIPGYNALYEGVSATDYTLNSLYRASIASENGVYGQHGHQNPPIPYNGRVYMHRSNALIALGNYQGAPTQLPMAARPPTPGSGPTLGPLELSERLEAEVQKMLDAGHLRPGYRSHGLLDNSTRAQIGDLLIDYWHAPTDTLYALAIALPYLSDELQAEVRSYMQQEYAAYPPYQVSHVGWRDGAAREPYDLPREAELDRVNYGPQAGNYSYAGWTWPPTMFYGLWKYAEVFGGAASIYSANRSRLESPPSDAYLIEYPYVLNAYIAGYIGYLELQVLAGQAESSNVRTTLNRLLALRANSFDKDIPATMTGNSRSLSVARNFMWLVPELGQHLRSSILPEVQAAVDEYAEIAPYWFVADHDTAHGESATQIFFDYHAMFLAKAYILQEPAQELARYLDVPAVQVGDLFYIQNLVAALEAGAFHPLRKSVSPASGQQGDTLAYTLSLTGNGDLLTVVDRLPAGVSAPFGIVVEGTSVAPSYQSGAHQLTWSDTVPEWQDVTIRYQVTITTGETRKLANTATLQHDAQGTVRSASATVIANPQSIYLAPIQRFD
jgi:hypothetical protein